MAAKQSGTVKRWLDTKGFGFIAAPDGEEIFVHQSEVQAEGFRSLAEGEPVEYELITDHDGRKKAAKVTGPDGANVKGAPRREGGGRGRGGADRGYGDYGGGFGGRGGGRGRGGRGGGGYDSYGGGSYGGGSYGGGSYGGGDGGYGGASYGGGQSYGGGAAYGGQGGGSRYAPY
eukprot:NODE_1655_length_780_cov_29.024502_g1606_i0.p2 GENE.NODE_1655_length_780_cov_29.024502_g1606_i0~~NODE_1655_length_780_cov_29.024502_g1606_i0.p2  ORF type:complete len:174 (-),score=50.18 NODE_1655_length_780_cov_29.024502_g1606_i0:172-693(-)